MNFQVILTDDDYEIICNYVTVQNNYIFTTDIKEMSISRVYFRTTLLKLLRAQWIARLNCTFFDIWKKFVVGCSPTRTRTQKFWMDFWYGILIKLQYRTHFGIVRNDFQSSTNWAVLIWNRFCEVENSKIQPMKSKKLDLIIFFVKFSKKINYYHCPNS